MSATSSQKPLSWWTGTWNARQWTRGAEKGGDPDPEQDEAFIRISSDGVLRLGDDNLEGQVPLAGASIVFIPSASKDVIAVSANSVVDNIL